MMNDQDYIRKAVELADGWEMSSGFTHWRSPSQMAWSTRELHQYEEDALAAQLVRQVDALDHWQLTVDRYSAFICGSNNESMKSISGPDRTLNTIKTIVDSEVLE